MRAPTHSRFRWERLNHVRKYSTLFTQKQIVYNEFMKIALVHEMLVKLGGAERVLKHLTEMFPQSPVYTLLHNAKKTDAWFGGTVIHPSVLQKRYVWLKKPKLFLTKMSSAVEHWDFSDYDLVISSSSAFAHGIKTHGKTKHICYVHSPMRYAWDYTHEYTKHHSGFMRYSIAAMLSPIRQWDYRTAKRPDIFIANSQHVRKRIQKYWRQDASVIYPPVDVDKFTPQREHENYFLIVSALTGFKRIDLAIKTFNKIGRPLVIIGDGKERKSLQKIAKDNIKFLGYQNDNVVQSYMQNCRALIFPGEEDFGITPVEAMAAGKPVLAYGIGGVTESVQAGVSGEFFYEPTPDAMEDGLARLLANEQKYDAKKIRQIAEAFDGFQFQKKIKEVITSLS